MVNIIRQYDYPNLCYSSKLWFANSFDLHYYNDIGDYNFWKRFNNDSYSNNNYPSTSKCTNDIIDLFDTN
jgi:hypothetical protein